MSLMSLELRTCRSGATILHLCCLGFSLYEEPPQNSHEDSMPLCARCCRVDQFCFLTRGSIGDSVLMCFACLLIIQCPKVLFLNGHILHDSSNCEWNSAEQAEPSDRLVTSFHAFSHIFTLFHRISRYRGNFC